MRHPTGRWSLYALQAKKLYPDDRYQMLNRVTESLDQLDKLERFARQLHALPLYLLYNHPDTAECSQHWHCKQPFAERQLGCTLVPSWHIRRLLRRPPPPRNFDSAHKVKQARPWRCAFDCPIADQQLIQMGFRDRHSYPDTPFDEHRQYDWRFEPMEAAWPERLFHTSGIQLTRKDMDQIRNDVSRSVAEDARRESTRSDERWLYPARLLIVDRWQELLIQSGEPQPPAQSRP